jgi:hypothetical protein
MQFRLLTRDELRATGWTEHGSAPWRSPPVPNYPSGYTHTPRTSGISAAGSLVEIPSPELLREGQFLHLDSEEAEYPHGFEPRMLLAGRIREDIPETQLRIWGIGNDVYAYWRGKWMPLPSRSDVWVRAPQVEGVTTLSWPHAAFESSPVVDLAFGRLEVITPDGRLPGAAGRDAAPAAAPATRRLRVMTRDELLAAGWEDRGDSLWNANLGWDIPDGMQVHCGREVEVRESDIRRGGGAPGGFFAYDGWNFLVAMCVPAGTPAPTPRRQPRPKSGLPEAALRFRDAPRIGRLALLTCGFELETQETEGHTWTGVAESETYLDEEAWADAVSSRVSEILGDVPGHLPSSLLTRVEEAVRESVEEDIPQSDYEREADPAEWMRDNYRIPTDVQVGHDGSVSGFEFRTRGALTYMRFRRAAEGIYRLSHDVDTECSFHIHLAVRGVKHQYGERMQMALVEYLTRNISRVPESVRTRWTEDNQYISRLVSEAEKYSFIRFHPQGTWEFRCFGNVQSSADAMRCLDLAVDAMQFAYRAVSGQASLLADSMRNRSEWETAVKRSLRGSKKLDDVVAERPAAQVA